MYGKLTKEEQAIIEATKEAGRIAYGVPVDKATDRHRIVRMVLCWAGIVLLSAAVVFLAIVVGRTL